MVADMIEQTPPESADRQDSGGQQFGHQPFRFATEGAMPGSGQFIPEFPPEDPKTANQLNADIGSGQAAGPRFPQVTGGQEKTQDSGRHNHLKAALVGSGITAAVGGVVLGALSLLNRGNSQDLQNPDPTTGVSGEVTQVDPGKTHEINPSPTVEATLTPKVEKYPLELGKEKTLGSTSFGITSSLMNEGVKIIAGSTDTRLEGIKLTDVRLNTEDYPDAEKRLNDAIMTGHYRAWQSQNPDKKDLSYEGYVQKVNNGEDLSYTLLGYKGEDILDVGEIKVDPRKQVRVVLLSSPSTLITPFAGDNYGYRSVNDELVIELFDYKAFKITSGALAGNTSYNLSLSLAWALALMSDREVQEKRELPSDRYAENAARGLEIGNYLMPEVKQKVANSILVVE